MRPILKLPAHQNDTLKTTVRIKCIGNDNKVYCASGFFFSFQNSNEMGVAHKAMLVTNAHCIENVHTMYLTFTVQRRADPNSGRFIVNTVISGEIMKLWRSHPDESVDLAAFPFAPLVVSLRNNNWNPVVTMVSRGLIPNKKELESLSPLEDVYMIGYPDGIYDERNNLPICRKGITATLPSVPFNGNQEFLLDIAVFEGSSGSPVFLLKRNTKIVNSEGTVLGGEDGKFYFIGVLQSGFAISDDEKIEPVKNLSTVSASKLMHLGNAISSTLLLGFENYFSDKTMEIDYSS